MDQQGYADAMTAFDAYYDTLSRYGRRAPAKRYQEHRYWKTFMKIGELCRKHGFDIVKYVGTMISVSEVPTDQISPHGMCGEEAAKKFEAVTAAAKSGPESEWKMYKATVRLTCDNTGTTQKAVLLSPMYSFPAWFRVFSSTPLDEDIIREWGPDAVEEMAVDPEITTFLENGAPSKMAAFRARMGACNG